MSWYHQLEKRDLL